MGKGTYEESRLRKNYQIHNTETHAVSENINVSGFSLQYLEDMDGAVQVQSPIMKKLQALPAIPANPPAVADLVAQRQQAQLKPITNAKKREKEMARVRERHTLQKDFASQVRPHFVYDDNMALSLDELENLDLSEYMYDGQKTDGFHKLVSNYAALGALFGSIPALKTAIEGEPAGERKDALLAKLSTLYDLRAHYAVMEQLLSNKYYAALPYEEMKKLSYKDMRMRLDELYEADPRNTELIDYYQNLIRLKEVGLSDGASVQERMREYTKQDAAAGGPAAPNAPAPEQEEREKRKELTSIMDAYKALTKRLDAPDCLMDPVHCKLVFFKTFAPDIARCLNVDPKTPEMTAFEQNYNTYVPLLDSATADRSRGILNDKLPANLPKLDGQGAGAGDPALSDEQKEWVRRSGAMLLKNGGKNLPLVASFLSMPPAQQLSVLYLIEHKDQASSGNAGFFVALNNYRPDVDKALQKPDFEQLSVAMRGVMKMKPAMSAYAALSQSIHAADRSVGILTGENIPADATEEEQQAAANATAEQKQTAIASAINERGKLLLVLYRTAGLHPDMPPDMAEDPVLRKKLYDEINAILKLAAKLQDLVAPEQADEAANAISYDDPQVTGVKEEKLAKDKKKAGFTFRDAVDYTKDGLKYTDKPFRNIVKLLGKDNAPFSAKTEYAHYGAAMGGINGLLGFIGSIYKAHKIRLADGLTAADRTAQAIGVTGGFIGSAGGLTGMAGSITKLVTDAPKFTNPSSWIGEYTTPLWESTNVVDKITVASGALSIVAGTAQLVSSSIQVARENSNKRDVENARQTIKNKEDNGTALSEEEKLVKVFLNHQDRAITRAKVSGGIGIATGILAMASGVLTMTGFLAPIGAIIGLTSLVGDVFGRIFSKCARNRDRRKTVDERLNIDALVTQVRTANNHPLHDKIARMTDSRLKDAVRQEALAAMGYASYHDCYRDTCVESAELLYRKVFADPRPADWQMYRDSMSSLGIRIDEEKKRPTIEEMVTKLMG